MKSDYYQNLKRQQVPVTSIFGVGFSNRAHPVDLMATSNGAESPAWDAEVVEKVHQHVPSGQSTVCDGSDTEDVKDEFTDSWSTAPIPPTQDDSFTTKRRRPSSSRGPSTVPQTTSIDNQIQNMMGNLALRISNEFSPLGDPHADTLIYIGPPPRSSHQDSADYAHINRHFHRFQFVHSSNLKALDSKRFGDGEGQLLGPGACIRAKKRLRKLDIYQKMEEKVLAAIKYHIDMRPPSEDDEAVLLLTDLTCSRGIRTWYRAQDKYGIPTNLVMGTDELNTESNPYHFSSTPDPVDPSESSSSGEAPAQTPSNTSVDLCVPELCPLRQHSAVERFLHAIFGNDPKIDSAPKLWAFFATANHYDCARDPTIYHWIEKWLTAGTNANFIQNNPEVAYRIGMGSHINDLVRDAFSILVGEKALLDVQSELSATVLSSKFSVHGREFENLDDDERNRIGHAASSLVRRVRRLYQAIAIDLNWFKDCAEYMKLSNFQTNSHKEQEILDTATSAIKTYCAGRIEATMRKSIRGCFGDLDTSASNTKSFRNGIAPDFDVTYNALRMEARPFTRSFWMALERIQFSDGRTSSATANLDEFDYQPDVHQVTTRVQEKIHVMDSLTAVNDISYERSLRRPSNPPARSSWGSTIGSGVGGLFSRWGNQRSPQDSDRVSHEVGVKLSNAPANAAGAQTTCQDSQVDSQQSPKTPKRPMFDFHAEAPQYSIGKRRRTNESTDQDRSLSATQFEAERTEKTSASTDHGGSENTIPDELLRSPSKPAFSHILPVRGRTLEQFPKSGKSLDTNAQEDALAPPSFSQEPGASLPAQASIHVDSSDANMRTSYIAQEDTDAGFSVFPLVEPHDTGSAAENKSTDTRWTTPAPGFAPSEQATFDHARPDPFPGNEAPLYRPPEPKVLQQFSDTAPATPDVNGRFYWANNRDRVARASEPEYFSLDRILAALSKTLSRKCDEVIYPTHIFHSAQQTPINLVDTMLCLDDDEWKYLPLWAGGFDDGRGGVFDEVHVPNDDAAGFRGGRRGIGSGSLNAGEGSVSGSESSDFDDIASEAISTVGRASRDATDGTATVKSISEQDTMSDDGFMNQDEVYAAVQAINVEKLAKGKSKETTTREWVPGDEFDFDGAEEDGDVSTIMGAGSDVQGQFFGDDGADEGEEESKVADEDNDEHEDDDDVDMEVIDKDRL